MAKIAHKILSASRGAPILALALLAACEAGDGGQGEVPGNSADMRPFDGIAAGEPLNAAGTEPFWSIRVEDGVLVYSTPENIDGTSAPVERFAGRGGVSFSGTLAGEQIDLAITPGQCSDGMSDRTYPFHATLAIGAGQRSGCAWRDTDDLGPPP